MTVRVLYNNAGGVGITLSLAAIEIGKELSGDPLWGEADVPRHDETLIRVFDIMGDKTSTTGCPLATHKVTGPYRIEEKGMFEKVVQATDMEFVSITSPEELSEYVVVASRAGSDPRLNVASGEFLTPMAEKYGAALSTRPTWGKTFNDWWIRAPAAASKSLIFVKVIRGLGPELALKEGYNAYIVRDDV